MSVEIDMTTPDKFDAGLAQVSAWMGQQVSKMSGRESAMETGILFWARCKRNNQLCVVTYYGADSGIRGTDPNCFRQLLADYDIFEPVMVPAHVLDWLSTMKINDLPNGEPSSSPMVGG